MFHRPVLETKYILETPVEPRGRKDIIWPGTKLEMEVPSLRYKKTTTTLMTSFEKGDSFFLVSRVLVPFFLLSFVSSWLGSRTSSLYQELES